MCKKCICKKPDVSGIFKKYKKLYRGSLLALNTDGMGLYEFELVLDDLLKEVMEEI